MCSKIIISARQHKKRNQMQHATASQSHWRLSHRHSSTTPVLMMISSVRGQPFFNIWVRSRRCGCLVTWFCYHLIAKPGNKAAAHSWPKRFVFISIRPGIYFFELLSYFCAPSENIPSIHQSRNIEIPFVFRFIKFSLETTGSIIYLCAYDSLPSLQSPLTIIYSYEFWLLWHKWYAFSLAVDWILVNIDVSINTLIPGSPFY